MPALLHSVCVCVCESREECDLSLVSKKLTCRRLGAGECGEWGARDGYIIVGGGGGRTDRQRSPHKEKPFHFFLRF